MAIDLIQKYGKKLTKPQIRLWFHPISGKDDYYATFKSYKEAQKVIKDYAMCEEEPLIAYDGFEMTLKHFKKLYPKVKLKEE